MEFCQKVHHRFMMRLFLWTMLLLSPSVAAQVVLSGRVVDEDGAQVRSAQVELNENGTFRKTLCDARGKFVLSWYGQFPATITVSHPGYEAFTYELTRKDLRRVSNDTISLRFTVHIRELRPAVVYAVARPDTVFGSEQVSIADYAFIDSGMICLSYEHNMNRGNRLLWMSDDGKVLAAHEAPSGDVRLWQDYRRRVYVLDDDHVHRVVVSEGRLVVAQLDAGAFYEQIYPVVDSCGPWLYYSNYSTNYPAFAYSMFDRRDSSNRRFCEITDVDMMELYRAEYKYRTPQEKLWAFRQEVRTGIDREIWAGAMFFTGNIYYKPVYAPMFVKKDTLLVFDHYRNLLLRYDRFGLPVDSMPVAHHLQRKPMDWQEKLIYDRIRHQVYALYMEGGYAVLCLINQQTGAIAGRQRLYFRYPENIQVRDGRIYYIYRPFESLQKKFLYSEKVAMEE
jgi:hypothetical protein